MVSICICVCVWREREREREGGGGGGGGGWLDLTKSQRSSVEAFISETRRPIFNA